MKFIFPALIALTIFAPTAYAGPRADAAVACHQYAAQDPVYKATGRRSVAYGQRFMSCMQSKGFGPPY